MVVVIAPPLHNSRNTDNLVTETRDLILSRTLKVSKKLAGLAAECRPPALPVKSVSVLIHTSPI
jgi:hypothetical protein